MRVRRDSSMGALLISFAAVLGAGCSGSPISASDASVDASPSDGCTPRSEVCANGVDDDCDDEVDELPCLDEAGLYWCVPLEGDSPPLGLPMEAGDCVAPTNPGCLGTIGVLTRDMDVVVQGRTEGQGNDFGSLFCRDASVDTEDHIIGLHVCDPGFYEFTVLGASGGLAHHVVLSAACPPDLRTGEACGGFDCGSGISLQGLAGDDMAVVIDGDNEHGGAFALRIRWTPSL